MSASVSEFVTMNKARVAAQVAVLAGCLCASAVFWPALVAAQKTAPVPDLSGNSEMAWFVVNDEFQQPPSGPGPVTFDKRYPYVDNAAARRTNSQPTYRIADLSNPLLQPWAREQMREANEEVLAGKVPYRAPERCHQA